MQYERKCEHDFGKVELAVSAKNTGQEGRLSKTAEYFSCPIIY